MKKLLIFASVLGVLGYFGSKFYLHDKVSRNLDMVLNAARPFADVEYTDVSSTLSGRLSIHGIIVQVAPFTDTVTIESVSIITPGYFDLLGLAKFGSGSAGDFEVPDSLGIAFKGMRVAVGADFMEAVADARRAQYRAQEVATPATECVGLHGFSSDTLERLGYRELIVDAAVGYRRENDKLVIDLSTDVEDMYDMAMAMTLEGMPTPQSVAMGSYRPRLVDGRLEYVDQSLEERVMKLCTGEEQLPAEAVIAARVEALQAVAGQNGIEFNEHVIDPYVEFLGGKDRFVIKAEPWQPVDLTKINLYKPSDVPALLNITAEAI